MGPIPESPYIFRKALLLEDGNDKETSVTMGNPMYLHIAKNADEESKAIIYNLALSYLYAGEVKKKSSLRRKARQLFEKIIDSMPNPSSKQRYLSQKNNCCELKDSDNDDNHSLNIIDNSDIHFPNPSFDTVISNPRYIVRTESFESWESFEGHDSFNSHESGESYESFESHELILTQ